MPKLSIIIATYNSATVVSSCLESIAAQAFTDFEIVLVDGASKDNTLDIVRSFDFPNMKLISEPDNGVYSAWNKGLQNAKGEWITFIGSDDIYASPDALKNLIAFSEQYSESPFVYGKLATVDQGGSIIGLSGSTWRIHNGVLQNFIFAQFSFPIMTAFYRREFIGNQKFDEKYKIIGDMDLVLRCLNQWKGNKPVFYDEILLLMGLGGLSTNPRFYWTSISEAYRCRWNNNISVVNLGLTKKTFKVLVALTIRKTFGPEILGKIQKIIRAGKRIRYNA